jgi:hypothetical protein
MPNAAALRRGDVASAHFGAEFGKRHGFLLDGKDPRTLGIPTFMASILYQAISNMQHLYHKAQRYKYL